MSSTWTCLRVSPPRKWSACWLCWERWSATASPLRSPTSWTPWLGPIRASEQSRLAKTHQLHHHLHLHLAHLKQNLKQRRKRLHSRRRSYRHLPRWVDININCCTWHAFCNHMFWKVKCEECGHLMARSSLARHVKLIHPVKRNYHHCEPPCVMKFKSSENLKAHKLRDSCMAGKENLCPHCHQHIQGSIKEHTDKNICLMQFLCTDCDQGFRLKRARNKHMRQGCYNQPN